MDIAAAMPREHDNQVSMGNVVAGYGKAIEVDSPYYLHPSDHPGLVFVTHPLTENGENYFTWRRNMMTALESKNKVGFIDNFVTKPNVNPQDFQPWVKCNAIVLSWLTNSLAKEIQSSAAHTKIANNTFTTVRSQILSVDPLPTLGRSYAIASQEEKQKMVAASCTPMIETTALLAKGKKTSGHDNGEQQQRCTHSNKLNHTKETCYQLVGYPSHWTRKPTRDAQFGGSANTPHTCIGIALAATVTTPNIQNRSPTPGLTAAQH
ncbi:hypothetical protein RJ639_047520 [Escallonia herrerae]|uniref:Retrotransposon Copia-like N-terminal domain-containing protein n=1 Tax=Escallonia herrerae TaxID=1293975 RepID=A0AA88W7Y7_9ASTE|nr:hypothetical protein RJ639_047520 [Escallonia herrerae]